MGGVQRARLPSSRMLTSHHYTLNIVKVINFFTIGYQNVLHVRQPSDSNDSAVLSMVLVQLSDTAGSICFALEAAIRSHAVLTKLRE